jgi:hypothetical protein
MSSQDFVRSLPGTSAVTSNRGEGGIGWDPTLVFTLLLVIGFGLTVLYSALGGQETVFKNQLIRIAGGVVVMMVAAQLSPRFYLRLAPLFYGIAVVLVARVAGLVTCVLACVMDCGLPCARACALACALASVVAGVVACALAGVGHIY